MTDRNRSSIDDISASSQRVRLLERLQLGPIDTITARVELNVLHPAARIQELRESDTQFSLIAKPSTTTRAVRIAAAPSITCAPPSNRLSNVLSLFPLPMAA